MKDKGEMIVYEMNMYKKIYWSKIHRIFKKFGKKPKYLTIKLVAKVA